MIKFGIVGFGIMGRLYGRIISESSEAELVAVATKSEASRQIAVQRHGVRAYGNAFEMFDKEELDAVYIATPDFLHFDFARAALENDINVLLEKPMTMSVKEAEKLVEIERRSKGIGTIRFGNRFAPAFLKLKEALGRGELGEIISISARLNDTIYVPTKMLSWSSKTTPAWFLMSHLLDLAYDITHKRPLRVAARGGKKLLVSMGIDTYDIIHAEVEFEGGIIGTFETAWILPESMPSVVDSRWEIIGEKGTAFLNPGGEMITVASHSYSTLSPLMVEINGKLEGYLVHMLNLFLDAVKGEIPNPVPFEDGLLNVKTLAAVHDAIAQNSWIPIN